MSTPFLIPAQPFCLGQYCWGQVSHKHGSLWTIRMVPVGSPEEPPLVLDVLGRDAVDRAVGGLLAGKGPAG